MTTMEAQQPVSPTLYDAEALRVESKLGNQLLVRGRDGNVVGKIGGFHGLDLSTALASSPDAVREAREHNRRYTRGSIVLALGLVAWGVGAGVSRIDGIDANVAIPAWSAVAGGTFLIAYGAVQLNKASSALAKAIWWYNRDLTR